MFCYQLKPLIVLQVCLLRELTALSLVLATGLVVTVEEGLVASAIYEHSICSSMGGSHRVKNSLIFKTDWEMIKCLFLPFT